MRYVLSYGHIRSYLLFLGHLYLPVKENSFSKDFRTGTFKHVCTTWYNKSLFNVTNYDFFSNYFLQIQYSVFLTICQKEKKLTDFSLCVSNTKGTTGVDNNMWYNQAKSVVSRWHSILSFLQDLKLHHISYILLKNPSKSDI